MRERYASHAAAVPVIAKVNVQEELNDSLANFLLDRLLQMLRVHDGSDLSGRIGCPVWCDDFNRRFTCVNPVKKHGNQ